MAEPSQGSAGAPGEGSERASNLNLSKSNREAAGGDDDPDEAAINNTKSNIKNREEPGGVGTHLAVADEGVPADKPSPKTK